ncbi:carnitine 3-dehydrogenase [Pelagibius sp.]|uniref:carnitine 3-dehydrogenase n=1 Tax=Pelagibius sp. TaxID=1931238 RepID=UPI003BB06D1D
MKAAIIGGGVIGGGWAARFLLNGWDVAVFDPDAEAERKVTEVIANARRSLPGLYDRALPEEGSLRFCASLSDAVSAAAWVQESVPERLDLKQRVLSEIQAAIEPSAVIASSTSGFKPSELQAAAQRPEQILVCHPFNPVYLLPLVEVVPSDANTQELRERCTAILQQIGMKPLVVRREIDAHIADRLLEAVWREALWLVKDDVATTQEIDDAIRFGFGLRWAQMGLFETYRIAGGEGGMAHFMKQFGPALKWPWTKLMDVPELTDDLVARIAEQSDAQSGHHDLRRLERLRDDNLVAILRALKNNAWGAGETLATHEETLPDPAEAEAEDAITVERRVPYSWTDYNGHMNEAHYLEVFAQASDRFMALIGADADYIDKGSSYFTVESHLRHLDEVKAGEDLRVRTRVIGGDGRKLHLFHQMESENRRLAATGEHLLIHVDLKTRRSSTPGAEISENLLRYQRRHSTLGTLGGVGRFVGQRH